MTRLQGIKKNNHLYDKSKIAKAEAVAVEAVRMAEEAQLAAARLNGVKQTLSLFLKKLDKVEHTVQTELTSPKSMRIDTTTVVEKEPVVLAVEASLTRLAAARTARLSARSARLRLAAARSVSVFSRRQMEGPFEHTTTVQKEVVVVDPFEEIVFEELTTKTKEDPVKDKPTAKYNTFFEELTNTSCTKKKETIDQESTKEEKATIETSIKESTKEDPSEEQESTKEEIAMIESFVKEFVTEDPSEDSNAESEYEKKDEEVQDKYNKYKKSMKVKNYTKGDIAAGCTLVEILSVKKKKKDPSEDASTQGEVATVKSPVEVVAVKKSPSEDESIKGDIAIETVIETGRVVKVLETWKVVTPTTPQGIVVLGKTTGTSVGKKRQQDVRDTIHKDKGIVAFGKKTGSSVDNKNAQGVVRIIQSWEQKDVRDNTHKDKGIVAFGKKTGSSVDNKNAQGVVRINQSWEYKDVRDTHNKDKGIIAIDKTKRGSSNVDNNKSTHHGVVRVIETGRQQDVRDNTHKNKGIVAFSKKSGSNVDNKSARHGVVRVIETGRQQDVRDNTCHNKDKDQGSVAVDQTKTGSSSVDNNNHNSTHQGVVRVIETGRQQDVRSSTTTTAATTGPSSAWFGTITAATPGPRSQRSLLRRILRF